MSSVAFYNLHTPGRQQGGELEVEGAKGGNGYQVAGAVTPLVELGRGLDRIELVVGENSRMAVKSQRRQHMELLLVGETAAGTERPPAGGEPLEERLALAELDPFFSGESGGNWNGGISHDCLSLIGVGTRW